ncbi:hypothetical protein BWK59_12710 [Flavobacterium davisii]|uniref:Uncharacterized protein n=1 Tax=Flavobacterium davisii TaxID=2906077 RepID=A0A246GFW4_9FLAO|nr:hypothetical protein [Flavobacterium davisii]OWP83025.1 hypothetical protein BWK59_12710 [Flavobacterium davisii]
MMNKYYNNEIVLPKGITGFTSINDFFEIPKINKDSILFKIEVLSTSLIDFEIPTSDRNYYCLTFIAKKDQKKYIVLFNSHFNFFAGVDKIDWMEKEFINLPDFIVQHFEENNFRYLNKDFLMNTLTKDILKNLAKIEIEQIDYWESSTVGEIVFNEYD